MNWKKVIKLMTGTGMATYFIQKQYHERGYEDAVLMGISLIINELIAIRLTLEEDDS